MRKMRLKRLMCQGLVVNHRLAIDLWAPETLTLSGTKLESA